MTIWSEQEGRYIEAESICFTGLGQAVSLIDAPIHPRRPAPPLVSGSRCLSASGDRDRCVACGRTLAGWQIANGTRRCASCRGARA